MHCQIEYGMVTMTNIIAAQNIPSVGGLLFMYLEYSCCLTQFPSSPGRLPMDPAFLWPTPINRMLTWESHPSPCFLLRAFPSPDRNICLHPSYPTSVWDGCKLQTSAQERLSFSNFSHYRSSPLKLSVLLSLCKVSCCFWSINIQGVQLDGCTYGAG